MGRQAAEANQHMRHMHVAGRERAHNESAAASRQPPLPDLRAACTPRRRVHCGNKRHCTTGALEYGWPECQSGIFRIIYSS